MAGTKSTVDVTSLEKQRKGKNGITLSDYSDGAEPVISGELEIAGSLYYFNAEDMDIAGSFAGYAADSIFYGYVDPVTIVPYLSQTAPAWDIDKNGYYLSTAPTHRAYFIGYKDSGGNWDQKYILITKQMAIGDVGISLGVGANADHEIRFASDAKIYWDESEDEIWSDVGIGTYHSQDGGADVQLAQKVGAGNSAEFTIKKSCACYMSVVGGTSGSVYVKYSGGYLLYNPVSLILAGTTRGFNLNPGTYVITNSGAATSTLYAVGVYGSPTVTASEIVV